MPNEEEAAEAFGVLADPTRIAILRAFAEALDQNDDWSDDPMPILSFSDVYERIDADSTSQLSYHLEKLDGTYLRQVDEGWKFTFAGESVVRLFLSGAYAGSVTFEPVAVEGRCPFCDAEALRVVVDDLALLYECNDCERRTGGMHVTPAQVRGRDAESLLASANADRATLFWRFRENICNECGGAVDVEFHDGSAAGSDVKWTVRGRCRQCWRVVHGPPSIWLATHPASTAFHWDNGIDARTFGFRYLLNRLESGDWRTERVAPDEYETTYRVDDAELRLTVDDDLSVLRTERVRRNSALDT
ncbi:winged helix-turn-helix domain-containing protein [Halostagnicola kamekurae]|uniref:Helix-turn-helix domain-containing protein n=1 Tax=Halostagnicola kamekurae TaxID=619731 RepID=A0A1I6P0U1_9EURY|nr:helix-turn-helix domain-containing protein [Halostagnicola kamekurae]SFS33834.1 Helix-turn-helix domain-containing protein [Halostagnicola kamekurae]